MPLAPSNRANKVICVGAVVAHHVCVVGWLSLKGMFIMPPYTGTKKGPEGPCLLMS